MSNVVYLNAPMVGEAFPGQDVGETLIRAKECIAWAREMGDENPECLTWFVVRRGEHSIKVEEFVREMRQMLVDIEWMARRART